MQLLIVYNLQKRQREKIFVPFVSQKNALQDLKKFQDVVEWWKTTNGSYNSLIFTLYSDGVFSS